jgi:hypothetical protein
MGIWCELAVLAGLACGLATDAGQTATPTRAEVLREIRAMRKEVDDLTERVAKLRGEVEGENGTSGRVSFGPSVSSRVSLSDIKLPDDPTKEQVREYVGDVLRAFPTTVIWFSFGDPHQRMLEKVGHENLDVLLEYVVGRQYSVPSLSGAIAALTRDDDKERILAELPRSHSLINVVLERGWTQDARQTLIDGLRQKPGLLPPEWVRTVASFEDPATYEALVNYFIHGAHRHDTYKALKNLPAIDLTDAVGRAWREARWDNPWETRQMAEIAMQHGHIDALGYLVEQLDDDGFAPLGFSRARGLVLIYTEARGTNEDIRVWFDENRDKLVFDPGTRKYVIREDE